MVVAGDSAGANLAFGTALKAQKAGDDIVSGLYLLCPYSSWALRENSAKQYPSMAEFDGYFISEGLILAVRK